MKQIIKSITCMLFAATLLMDTDTAYSQTKNPAGVTDNHNTAIFPQGDPLPDRYFTGNAYLMPLLARDKNNDFIMGNVSFEPHARTNWHTHPKGQVLIVTDGVGFYQEKGKPARPIKKGDVINIPENTKHWHGAGAGTKMVHIAITHYQGDTNVVWLEPVSDQEYNAVNKR